MASFLQIGALLILLIWCFNIVRPFVGIVVWAVIIAVAVYPVHVSLTGKLGGREKLSASILVLIGLAIILFILVNDLLAVRLELSHKNFTVVQVLGATQGHYIDLVFF